MTTAAGSRLGPYEVLSPLGSGGMGEVYRARDTRLSREVAIKVLPAAVASDPERLKRFEKEARAASALNHPSIVTIYDVGQTGGLSWIAMELVEGKTLRELLVSGALAPKRCLQLATSVAEGLSRAHEAGIVHRDLKPENVMVTREGLVKILDFGLAKLTSTGSGSDEASQLPTMTGTTPGVVLGTVGYMSPEQASGEKLDFRSDQFSLGSVVYELLTGKRAFQRKTAVDTLSAILNEEPQSIAALNAQVPAPLRWIVERCLAKDPEDRYGTTKDLARELANVRDHLLEVSSNGVTAVASARRSRLPRILGVFGAAALLALAYIAATRRPDRTTPLRFQKVTFQRGGIWSAQFAADGQTVVYAILGVGDDNTPAELYSTRVGSVDSRLLGLPPADILAISPSDQMAIRLTPAEGRMTYGIGTLAEASLSGGTPRPILEGVRFARWSPDGKALAVIHAVAGKNRVEYPVGTVLYETHNGIGGLNVSPDGENVYFTEWGDRGTLRVADRKGAVRTLKEGVGDGIRIRLSRPDEFWWIDQIGHATSEVHALTVKGGDRVAASLPGQFILHDLAGDDRMLVERVSWTFEMTASAPGEARERSLAWLDASAPVALSSDGRTLLFSDRAGPASSEDAVYLRQTDGSPSVRLGEGSPLALSPDAKWALARQMSPSPHLVLLPTGTGQARSLSPGRLVIGNWARFHPDGKRVFFEGSVPGHGWQAFEETLEAGSPAPVTPEGARPTVLSPDGDLLAGVDSDQNLVVFSTDAKRGAPPRLVTHLSLKDSPLYWSTDGRSLLIADDSARPIRVDRLDLSSGRRTPWRSFSPGGLLGGGGLTGLVLTASEQAWVIGYLRVFSDLLVIDGVK
jgi:hypothetical protein